MEHRVVERVEPVLARIERDTVFVAKVLQSDFQIYDTQRKNAFTPEQLRAHTARQVWSIDDAVGTIADKLGVDGVRTKPSSSGALERIKLLATVDNLESERKWIMACLVGLALLVVVLASVVATT